jgi:uncharacterized protein
MSDTLRDQLLGLGFKPAPRPERPAQGKAQGGQSAPRSGERPPQAGPARKHEHGAANRNAASRHAPGRDASHRGGPKPGGAGQPGAGRPAQRRNSGEMDLAKAYAIRAQKEKDERIAAEQARQAEAARRREGKLKLAELLQTASLNDPAAEIARHFEYGGKIRRIYVTAEQLRALNGGELAVVQQGGRYQLVTAQHAREAEALLPGALALLVDPGVPSADDVYADPRYQVPDDLVW